MLRPTGRGVNAVIAVAHDALQHTQAVRDALPSADLHPLSRACLISGPGVDCPDPWVPPKINSDLLSRQFFRAIPKSQRPALPFNRQRRLVTIGNIEPAEPPARRLSGVRAGRNQACGLARSKRDVELIERQR